MYGPGRISFFTRYGRSSRQGGFTLVELLVVVGVLAVIGTAATITLNPADLLRQTRDSTRVADLATVNKALSMYRADGGASFGAPNVVNVSIPDTSATCGNLGLPSLPAGWSYRCVTATNLTRTDGQGWVPVDLASMSLDAAIASLPIDPTNAAVSGAYYTYVAGTDAWELDARLESNKFGYGGSQSKASTDGGNNDYLYETGSDLSLLLDNENLIRDGDMELADTSMWADYSYNVPPPIKVKDSTVAHAGSRSLHLTTNDAGYEGTTQGTVSTFVPASGKVYIQMALKTAPGKTLGWECACSNLGCCWFTLFNNMSAPDWRVLSTVRTVSTSTGLTRIYISQPFGTASEFWVDDVIVRPVY